jgi:Transposase DDE domain group 1
MTVTTTAFTNQEESSLKVHRSRSVRRAKVIPDAKNLVSHAGAALLAELADRSGLTEAMSLAMEDCGISWHTHDPGVVLTHLAVAVADGADCLADIAALKEQEDLFGPVASVATAWRAVHATASVELRAIAVAMATARARVWAAQPPEGPMIWDFDSTLLNVHAEKEDAAATYKHGFGFNPLAAWCDNTNEPLGAMLRPGNAAPGNTDDHLELLEQVVRAVPAEYALGHEEGDGPALVIHPILVRADSAGTSHRFVQSLSDANFDYSIGFPISGSVRNALLLAQEEDWVRANEIGGGIRDGAEVIELSEVIELEGWPIDMRVICRRERPHPGAQLSLFDTHAGWRHTCFITNTEGDDIAALELRHRGHARVEDRVRC